MNKNDKTKRDNLPKSATARRLGFKQIIPGRYPSSAFIKVLPRVLQNPRSRNVVLRQGIPDAQCEYMLLQDVCKLSRKDNIPFQMACNNVRITENLWTQFGVELQQGIPDPFRFDGIIQCEGCLEKLEDINENSDEQIPVKESSESKVNKESTKSKKHSISDDDLKRHAKKCKKICKEQNEQKITRNQHFEDEQLENGVEEVKTACYSQKLYPFSNMKTRGQTQSRITRIVKGIVQKCRNTMKNISSSHSDYFDVNFVCHRCKCPYFRICALRQCSSPEKILRTFPPDSSEDSQENFSPNVSQKPSEKQPRGNSSKNRKQSNKSPENDKNKEKSKNRTEKKTDKESDKKTKKSTELKIKKKENTRKRASSRENHVLSANVLLEDSFSLTNSNSTTLNSIIEATDDKEHQRENMQSEEVSRSSSNSRASSERLKKYIYDCFPPKLEPMSAKKRFRDNLDEFEAKAEGFVIEDVKSFNDNTEDSSLRSKSSESSKHNRPFRLEEIFDEESSENKPTEASISHEDRKRPHFRNKSSENPQFIIQGIPQGDTEVSYLPAFINRTGKFGFVDENQIDDSGNVEILYGGFLVGALDKVSNMNEDLLIESYREHVSSDGK